jgi:alpha-galactosidase
MIKVCLAILLCLTGMFVYAQDIPLGAHGRLRYDLSKGTYSLSLGGMRIEDAYAQAGFSGDTCDSREGYTSRRWSVASFGNGLGKGMAYRVRLAGGGRPDMEQVFFVIGETVYLQLGLAGVACSYMAPMVGSAAEIGAMQMLRAPFDNDAWIRYDVSPPGGSPVKSSEVSVFMSGNGGLVLGSVDHLDWKTGVVGYAGGLKIYGGYTDKEYTRDMKGHGRVHVGKDGYCRSPRMMIGWYDQWRDGMDAYGVANRRAYPRYVRDWTKAKPFGWNSWGALQENLSLDRAKRVVDFFADSLRSFRNADNTLYIDLDSYWDNLIKGGYAGDFSQLTEFCRYCRSKGFVPGIYWAPFVDWGKSDRVMEGSSFHYGEAWTKAGGQYIDLDGARALDPTHPGTRERIALLAHRFRECGFGMIKIDFLGHAAVEADHYYDSTVTTGMQAYRKGMEWLIDQLGKDMLVYAAISPNLATGRYAHMRRIACDAYSDIGETEYTLNSTIYGWWQARIYDFVDADHVVFRDRAENVNRARLLSSVVTGTVILGDDYSVDGPWKARAQRFFQDGVLLEAARGGTFTPRGGGVYDGGRWKAIVNTADTISSILRVPPTRKSDR